MACLRAFCTAGMIALFGYAFDYEHPGRRGAEAVDLRDRDGAAPLFFAMSFPVQNFPQGFRLDQPERIQSSLNDTDASTSATVQAMCKHIANAQKDPWFLAIAHNITRSKELADKISSVFLWCKAAIRFQRDEESVWNLYKELNHVDFLIEPAALARMLPQAYGDCDEFTMFSLACLTALGVKCEIVTVACDRERPGFWSHVYGQVVLPDGRRLALDCSPAGKYPGWEVPAADVQRRQVWNLEGNIVYDAPPASRDLGLQAYIPRPRRGVGDINIEGSVPDPNADLSAPSAGIFAPAAYGTPSSSTGFNWNNLISNLTAVGSKLGTIALTPKGGYVATGPGGQTIVSNTGLPGSFSAFATGGTSNLLLWLAIGIGVVFVAKAASK